MKIHELITKLQKLADNDHSEDEIVHLIYKNNKHSVNMSGKEKIAISIPCDKEANELLILAIQQRKEESSHD